MHLRTSAWRGIPREDAADRWTVGSVQVRVSTWILFVSSLLITQCGAFCENHAIQVPLVNWLNDSSLYPQDPFASVVARYPSALWPLVALGARVFPLEGMLIALLVLERFFVLYAAGRLARAFAPHSGLAVVAVTALFAFAVEPVLGLGTIVEFYFEQTGLAIAFLLLAIAAFHARRPVAWAIWVAISFNLNPLYGVFALSYFGAAFSVDPDYRGDWRKWLRAFLVVLALTSYALWSGLSAASRAPRNDTLWSIAARARCWYHLYPLAWETWRFAQFGALLALFGTLLAWVRRERPRLFRHGLVWSLVACLWLLDAFVAAYVLGSRRLMMMQPARATDLWICFGATAIVCISAEQFEQASDSRRGQRWMIALGTSFLLWLSPGAWAVTALLLLTALPPVWRRIARSASPRRLAWLLVAWVSLVGIDAVRARWSYSYDLADLFLKGPEPAVRQIAAWAETHTPVDSVFLVNPGDDPDFDQFMGMAKRSIFTNWEQGTALYWAPDYVTEWSERLRALGFDITLPTDRSSRERLNEMFLSLVDDDVRLLKARYRLSHWVVPAEHPSRFRVAFMTEDFKVLEVR